MVNQSQSLSGMDDLIMHTFTFTQIEHPSTKFMQEMESAVTHPTVGHVYLSGHASTDVLLPYIVLLHKNKIPFTVVERRGKDDAVAIEVIRSELL